MNFDTPPSAPLALATPAPHLASDAPAPASSTGDSLRRRLVLALTRLLPALLTLLICGELTLAVLSWGQLLALTPATFGPGFDFAVYFAAALALRRNPHADIYNLQVIRSAAHNAHAQIPILPYDYPPAFAVSLIPLTALPFSTAYLVWRLINLGLWFICVALLTRLILRVLASSLSPIANASFPPRATQRLTSESPTRLLFALALALLLTLTSGPIWNGMGMGQVSLLILVLTTASFLLIERRPVWAGVALALAAWIKIVPLVILGYCFLRGRWRAVFGGACGLLAIALVLVAFTGWVGLSRITELLPNGGSMVSASGNLSPTRAPLWLSLTFSGHVSPLAAILGLAIAGIVSVSFVAGVSFATLWLARPNVFTLSATSSRFSVEALGYAWALCAMVELCPVVWLHTYTWLLPAASIALAVILPRLAQPSNARSHPLSRWRWLAALLAVALGYALVVVGPLYGPADLNLLPWLPGHLPRLLALLLHPVGAFLLWLTLGVLFLRAVLHDAPPPMTAPPRDPHRSISAMLAYATLSLIGALVAVAVFSLWLDAHV